MFRGAPDAQRGPVSLGAHFPGRHRWSEGPRPPGCAFLMGFCTYFVTSVWVSNAFAGVLALAGLRGRAFGPQGPENPKGATSCHYQLPVTIKSHWYEYALSPLNRHFDAGPGITRGLGRNGCWCETGNKNASFLSFSFHKCYV